MTVFILNTMFCLFTVFNLARISVPYLFSKTMFLNTIFSLRLRFDAVFFLNSVFFLILLSPNAFFPA